MGRPDAVFETDARRMGDVVVVSLTGELDMATAPAVQEAVERAQGEGPIAVDLRELTFIDSTGIRALLDIYAAGVQCARARCQAGVGCTRRQVAESTQCIRLDDEEAPAANLGNAPQFTRLADLGHAKDALPARPQVFFVLSPDKALEIHSPNDVTRLHEIQRREWNTDSGCPSL